MKKEDLLKELSEKLKSGEIRKEEVVSRLKLSADAQKRTGDGHFSVSKMLYILGATIVIIGLVFFISQIWGDIGSIGRIFVTLGLGLLLTALGSMLLNSQPQTNLGSVFHFIGGMLVPGGAMVALNEMSVDSVTLWPVSITFGVIFAFYMLLNYVHRTPVLTFFAIANFTMFVYVTFEAVVEGYSYQHGDLYAYLTMLVGISYLLLAHAFREGWNRHLVGILYFFGISGLLGAAFTRVFDSIGWQLLYFLLVIGGLFLAVYTKSRAILVMSTIFLISHVAYITSEYFADSIGWPISLVLLGFAFIGLGYASITINKRYMKA